MLHMLDNPIYAALTTGNKGLSNGSDGVFFFSPNVAPFVGLKENSADEFSTLYQMAPAGRTFILFSQKHVTVPSPWKTVGEMQIWQMVYEGPGQSEDEAQGIVSLNEAHVPAMLTLTKRTNPGPFLEHTIQFGNYLGFIEGGELLAMAGQRFQPSPYIEISAVCTHPAHTGKGYASRLLQAQVKQITRQGSVPFLHVRTDNTGAIKVYERLGFSIHQMVRVSIFQK